MARELTERQKGILRSIELALEAGGWRETEYAVPGATGTVTLTPCSWGSEIRGIEDVCWINTYGRLAAAVTGGTIEDVCVQIDEIDKRLADAEEDKQELRKIYERLLDPDLGGEERQELFNLYSDFHKSVFGVRPKGIRYGIA